MKDEGMNNDQVWRFFWNSILLWTIV